MATVYISIGKAAIDGRNVFDGGVRGETITSSGTAAAGSLTAQAGDIAHIFCATAVRASVDGSTASASNGIYCPGGVAVQIGMHDGKTVSVIDA